jgi:hypothetical protein
MKKPKRTPAIPTGISVFPAFSRFFSVFLERDPWGRARKGEDGELRMAKGGAVVCRRFYHQKSP